MNRIEVSKILAGQRQNVPMFISPGLVNYPIAAAADDPLTVYNMDMPYATPMALGVALAWPERKVVAVEGDGSMLCGIGVLTTIGRYLPQNLIVVVFDNGAYLTTGSGLAPTATAFGADIEAIGRASGLNCTFTIDRLEVAREAIERAFREPGPWLIVAKVDKSDREQVRRVGLPVDVFESCLRFRRAALR